MPLSGLLCALSVHSLLLNLPVARTWNFTQSIGVNTHMSWQGQYAYANVQVVENSLAYLGATHVRDGIPYAYWTLPEYVAIARTGVRFDILASGPTIDMAGDVAAATLLQQAVPASVQTMEGANEFNTQNSVFEGVNSVNDPAWAQLYAPPLYQAVHGAGTLPGTTVIAPSMANAGQTQIELEGNLSSFVDSSNWHTYYGNGDQPAANIAASIAAAQITAPGKPVTITETGYYTAIQAEDWGGGGVNFQVQAMLTLNVLLDAFSHGVATTYIYELLDNIANPPSTDLEDSFGLFLANGTPKPAATAVHNLVSILADTGAQASSFTTGSFTPVLTGLPSTANVLVLAKSNGNFYVVLWNEPNVWNEALHKQVAAIGTPVTVQLGATPAQINVYNPLLSASPRRSLHGVASVGVELGGAPLVLEIVPPAG